MGCAPSRSGHMTRLQLNVLLWTLVAVAGLVYLGWRWQETLPRG